VKGNLTEAVERKPKATRVIWQQRPKIQATESKPFCSRKIAVTLPETVMVLKQSQSDLRKEERERLIAMHSCTAI